MRRPLAANSGSVADGLHSRALDLSSAGLLLAVAGFVCWWIGDAVRERARARAGWETALAEQDARRSELASLAAATARNGRSLSRAEALRQHPRHARPLDLLGLNPVLIDKGGVLRIELREQAGGQ